MAATALGAASVLGYLDARLRLSSDLRVVFGATKAKVKLDRAQKQDKNSLWYLFEDAAKQRKGADCLVCEGRTLSWDEVYNRESPCKPLLMRRSRSPLLHRPRPQTGEKPDYRSYRVLPFLAGANQLANWMLEQGLQRGETIAIFLQNKPAYPILWLACLAIDV